MAHVGYGVRSLANPKTVSCGRAAAPGGASAGPGGRNLGGGLEGDGVAERFDLADVVSFAAVGVDAGGVEARRLSEGWSGLSLLPIRT